MKAQEWGFISENCLNMIVFYNFWVRFSEEGAQ
jgi:hypothetical protein